MQDPKKPAEPEQNSPGPQRRHPRSRVPDPPAIMAAVRSLRTALHSTQTDFGRMLGKSLPTIQRWETLRPPRGRALAQLFDLAKRHDDSNFECRNAAAIFHGALAEEMSGVPIPQSYTLLSGEPFPDIHPVTSEEARRVAALLAAIRDPGGAAEVERFDRLFKRRLAKTWKIELDVREERK